MKIIIKFDNYALDYIKHKQLNWYGHVQRMYEERLLEKFWNGVHLEEEKKGRPRNSWMQEVTTGMREKGIKNMEWIDREEWRRKIKLWAQKDVQTSVLLH